MENYVGKRLDGRYEIQDVVGVGGMAVVYKAYDNIDDRIVAVKILKDEYLANEEFRRRFKNESKAIAVLSHPNIVKVFDVSFGDRLQYIVMEYIEGITLKEYIEKRGVLEWREALFFIIQILRALQHAHDKGIVHRDIKPQNIMLLENGTIKVTDFGIARFSHSETRTVTEKAIGSVHYISPEQAKGELTDEKADLYSIGIVLYEMLTGKLPFDAESAVSVALMQVNTEPIPPRTVNPSIPIGFEQITMKAMQKNTRDRYQTAAEMLLDLEEFKRNPNVKFDYPTYFVDAEPTRFIGVQDKTRTIPVVSKTGDYTSERVIVPPANDTEKKVQGLGVGDISDAVQDAPKNKINTKTVAVIVGVAVAVVIFAIVVIAMLFKNGTLSLTGKKIEVESFIGKNYEEEIVNSEEYKDLYNFEVYYASFTDGQEGCVYDQDPKAGSTVTKGATIRLFIVKAGEGQIVPDFRGESYNQACDTLESMGFKTKSVPIEDDSVSVGQVVRTEPSANSSVLAGSTVTVYYAADTKSDELFKMPNLEGKSLKEAKEIIAQNNLLVTKVETTDSTVEKDYVLTQSPTEGSPVKAGDGVILTVSSGYLTTEKTVKLPKAGGVTVKVNLDGETIQTEYVDTNSTSSYTLSLQGNKSDSRLTVYLNDVLYYEASVDFTKTNVKFSREKTYEISFYVDVSGYSETDAVKTLNEAGYNNITIHYETSFEKEDTVINQSPSYNSAPNLDEKSSVVLTIAQAETTEPETTETTVPTEETTE